MGDEAEKLYDDALLEELHSNHDHTPSGQCLEVDWKGAVTKRGEPQGASQETIEENHRQQLIKWRKQAIKENVAPF